MGIWAHQLLLLQLLITGAFAGIIEIPSVINELQNPDFELPPSNIPLNSTLSFRPLNASINSIPSWSFQGSVGYVTNNGSNISNIGHSIYLGVDGKINQTIKASDESMHYLLTFNLAAAAKNCSTNGSVIVSFPDRSVHVSLIGFKFGKDIMWETHGVYLGRHGNEEFLNLILESKLLNGDKSNSTTICGPVLDSLILIKIADLPIKTTKDNLLVNGGFELGPFYSDNSINGVLMDEALSPTQSPLIQWSIIGTVKYITSNENYTVPEGKSAVEILSRGGSPSGIQTAVALKIEDNLLVNGGFELGPAFSDNSINGVLMDEALSPTQSPLIQWSIIGTVKYITSNENFSVPGGNAAVEILSRGGSPSGIQTSVALKNGSTYKLDFSISGDHNKACVGNFKVGVQAGSTVLENFTLSSDYVGGAVQGYTISFYTLSFKVDSTVTPISFLCFRTNRATDSAYCGPVIDKVVLYASYGLKLELPFTVLLSCMIFLVTIL